MSSIVWSLKRLFDPASHLWEESEKAALQDEAECTPDGEPPTYELDDETDPAAAATELEVCYRCRICGQQGSSGPYCLACLADTMEPVAADG